MSNETKRDVLKRALNFFVATGLVRNINYNLESYQYLSEYDAALPDDLPVIPKAVGEYIQEHKSAHESLAFALTARWVPKEVIDWMCMVAGDSDTELSPIEYMKQQDIFARAWVLDAWRVEETGEIMKLEVEK